MTASVNHDPASARLRPATVLRVQEDTCEVFMAGQARSVRYAAQFPSPRTERVAPGHLVAVATAPDGSEVVVWRWYDAVVLGEQAGAVLMWEPAHGEVLAQPRRPQLPRPTGSRAYLSGGLPGAAWWIAGAVATRPQDADVELDEVERFYDVHGLWTDLL